jgi:hypothetical protein
MSVFTRSTHPNEATLDRHQTRNLTTDQTVGDGRLAVRVELVRVGYAPRSVRMVVADASSHRLQFSLLRHKTVAVAITIAAQRSITGHSIDLKDSVLVSVDRGIQTKAEQMLMVVCIDAGIYFRTVRRCDFAWTQGVSTQDTSKLDLELDYAILV